MEEYLVSKSCSEIYDPCAFVNESTNSNLECGMSEYYPVWVLNNCKNKWIYKNI